MSKLPLGYSSFPDFVKSNKIYIDKTEYLYRMINGGKFYFLSRPRRFGKSLTVSTFKEIFKGSRELFKDTWIYSSDYNWKEYPVVQFDFSQFDADKKAEDLNQIIESSIGQAAETYGVTLSEKLTTLRFKELLKNLSKTAQVAILIDEYDNPILSNITNIEKADRVKDILKGFYKIIKACDEYVKFAFLTGVTKFSQVSVFSGLNNLVDITMDGRYSAVCGYTEEDIEIGFKEYIEKWAAEDNVSGTEIMDNIRDWYNGFLFSEDGVSVYNPWSVLNYFNTGKLKNYWFESGTPTFLIDLIKSNNFDISDSMNFKASREAFSTFDIEKLRVIPLLFQTGYITIKSYDKEIDYYTLGFPNKEVESSFLGNLLNSISDVESDGALYKLIISLKSNDLELFFEALDTLFSKVDYDLHLKDEKYWQSLFYMIFVLLGYKINAEFKTVKGRIDAVIETKTHIYIFEFKTSQSEEVALEQIKEREYYKRFKDSTRQIVLVGSRFVVEGKRIINRFVSLECN